MAFIIRTIQDIWKPEFSAHNTKEPSLGLTLGIDM